MHSKHILGWGIFVGVIVVLSLMAAGVMQHPASAQGSGDGLLLKDVALLALYASSGILVSMQRSASMITAAIVGAQVGVFVGAVGVANHLIEAFVPVRPFFLIIGPVFLTFALLGTAGAAGWERTGSLLPAVIAGAYCAIVGTLMTLCFAISFNLLFAPRVDWQLREAFAASGMIDREASRVRNILEASSEILVRMPVLGICLASAGAVIQAWMARECRRRLVQIVSLLAPIVFAVGTTALWHADAIERALRPPFVISGVLLTAAALCVAYPAWSNFHGSTRRSKGTGNS
jgi:hypothetical protein